MFSALQDTTHRCLHVGSLTNFEESTTSATGFQPESMFSIINLQCVRVSMLWNSIVIILYEGPERIGSVAKLNFPEFFNLGIPKK